MCRKSKCHLPHVDRAGQIRKHTANTTDPANGSADDDSSDLVSDDEYDEIDSDDVDSEGLDDDSMNNRNDAASQISHSLSQQQDYVHI